MRLAGHRGQHQARRARLQAGLERHQRAAQHGLQGLAVQVLLVDGDAAVHPGLAHRDRERPDAVHDKRRQPGAREAQREPVAQRLGTAGAQRDQAFADVEHAGMPPRVQGHA